MQEILTWLWCSMPACTSLSANCDDVPGVPPLLLSLRSEARSDDSLSHATAVQMWQVPMLSYPSQRHQAIRCMAIRYLRQLYRHWAGVRN
jgi:hypothetical protein